MKHHNTALSETINIVHIITSLGTGGAERTLTELIRKSSGDRFRHRVVCLLEPGPMRKQLDAIGIPIESLRMKRSTPSLTALRLLVRHLRENRCDILQTWLYHADLAGTIAGRAARVPTIIWNVRCSTMDFERYSPMTRLVVRLLSWMSHSPTSIICNSIAGQKTHEAIGYSPTRWTIIPNGIDTDRFQPQHAIRKECRRALDYRQNEFVIGMVARFDPMKDFETLLVSFAAVLKTHRQSRLLLTGPGIDTENQSLTRLTRQLGIQTEVTLLGPRESIEEIFAAMDLFVLSSRGEGFPNVIAEAMASGLPVISTDVGDARYLIGDTGRIVSAGNTQEMQTALTEAIDDPDWLSSSGASARQRIKNHFSLEQMVSRYERLYTSVIK